MAGKKLSKLAMVIAGFAANILHQNDVAAFKELPHPHPHQHGFQLRTSSTMSAMTALDALAQRPWRSEWQWRSVNRPTLRLTDCST